MRPDGDLVLGGGQQRAGQRALARAVGAHDGVHLAGVDGQRQPAQDLVAGCQRAGKCVAGCGFVGCRLGQRRLGVQILDPEQLGGSCGHGAQCISPMAVVETPPMRSGSRRAARQIAGYDGYSKESSTYPASVSASWNRGRLRNGHAGIDVVGQVPADVVRHQHEPGEGVLAHRVGGLAAILRALHAAVLGDRSQPVDHPPHGEVRRQPQDRVQPPVARRRSPRPAALPGRPGSSTPFAATGGRTSERCRGTGASTSARSDPWRRGSACAGSSPGRSGSRRTAGCRARRGRTRRGGAPCAPVGRRRST